MKIIKPTYALAATLFAVNLSTINAAETEVFPSPFAHLAVARRIQSCPTVGLTKDEIIEGRVTPELAAFFLTYGDQTEFLPEEYYAVVSEEEIMALREGVPDVKALFENMLFPSLQGDRFTTRELLLAKARVCEPDLKAQELHRLLVRAVMIHHLPSIDLDRPIVIRGLGVASVGDIEGLVNRDPLGLRLQFRPEELVPEICHLGIAGLCVRSTVEEAFAALAARLRAGDVAIAAARAATRSAVRAAIMPFSIAT